MELTIRYRLGREVDEGWRNINAYDLKSAGGEPGGVAARRAADVQYSAAGWYFR